MLKNVLIVDDDPVAQHILTAILEAEGLAVISCKTAKECLDFLESATPGKAPDLLFLDLLLPDKNGGELILEIRKVFPKQLLPVVLMSANHENELQDNFPGIEYEFYLEKPFTREVITALMQEFA